MIWILLLVLTGIIGSGILFLHQPQFGKIPEGERKERVLRSSHYIDGKFRNQHVTPQLTSDKSFVRNILGFLFRKKTDVRPHTPLPTVKTDLWQIDRTEEVLIWFGHSSYFFQTGGKRFLVDPIFGVASPVSFINKAFPGTEIYSPADIPQVDYLVISHDHWDHLDYYTVRELKDRTAKVICPLGVGAHFEHWGFEKNQLVELDWYEEAPLEPGFAISCLPARHFSGRGFTPNQSVWASFMLQTPSQNIYIGGDNGYDTHYREIGQKYEIDLAILENGQYDQDWRYIHNLPQDLVRTIRDLSPKRVLTVHHAKYALAKHPWKEPLEKISAAAEKESFPLITPRIGEIVYLQDPDQVFDKWWEEAD